MGLFDFMKVCLFSEVNGVVTLEGKPVAGAEIVRTAKFNDAVHTDKAVTDADGKFYFDAMYASSIKKILPIEPYISQKMTILYNNNEFAAWDLDKRDYELNGEFNRDLIIICNLDQKESRKEIGEKILWGICNLKDAN